MPGTRSTTILRSASYTQLDRHLAVVMGMRSKGRECETAHGRYPRRDIPSHLTLPSRLSDLANQIVLLLPLPQTTLVSCRA